MVLLKVIDFERQGTKSILELVHFVAKVFSLNYLQIANLQTMTGRLTAFFSFFFAFFCSFGGIVINYETLTLV